MADIGRDDTLPSVDTTMRFLALCERYGSQRRGGCPGGPACQGRPTDARGLSGTAPRCARWLSTSTEPAPE